MLHKLLMSLAAVSRWGLGWLKVLVVVFSLLALNVATVVSTQVFNAVQDVVWAIGSTVASLAGDRPVLTTRQKLQETEKKLKQANAKSTKMEKKALKLEAETARLEARAVRSESRLVSLNKTNSRLRTDLAQTNKKVASLSAQKTALGVSERRALKSLGSLRGRVARSVRRSLSSELVDAVPFVGVAAVIGSTAYEIDDACRQYRELQTLDALLRGKEPDENTDTSSCLLSAGEMYALVLGVDGEYEKCTRERKELRHLSPESCRSYDDALPDITVSATEYKALEIALPDIE